MELGKPGPVGAGLMMGAEKFQIEFDIGDIIELALKDFVDMVWTCIFIKSDLETMLDSTVMLEA